MFTRDLFDFSGAKILNNLWQKQSYSAKLQISNSLIIKALLNNSK